MYFCIDLKSFYASVECKLRNLNPFKVPLVVCDKDRGDGAITLAVTPYLKSFGVPSRTRVYLLPKNIDIIYAKPQMKKYIEYSCLVYKCYLDFFSKDDIFMYSIDEGFINVKPYLNYYNIKPKDLANKVKDHIFNTLGLYVSVGIGDNMFQSKIALDILAKHSSDFIGEVTNETFKFKFKDVTNLKDVWCIGDRLERRLHHLGIFTLQELSCANLLKLKEEFGIIGLEMYDHANGVCETTIEEAKSAIKKTKSVSHSQVLFRDYNKEDSKTIIVEMADIISLKLTKNNFLGKTIYLYIGFSKSINKAFKVSYTIDHYTKDFVLLKNTYLKMFEICPNLPIRHIGLSIDIKYQKDLNQISLFDIDESKSSNLQETIVNIKEKYGKNSVIKALSLLDSGNQIERNKMVGGHNA